MGCLCSQSSDYFNFPQATSLAVVDGQKYLGTNFPSQPLLKEVNFSEINDSDYDDINEDEMNNILEEESIGN